MNYLQKRAYGLYENSTKTIWISPITNKLGIYKNVLVHEAVHAAQSCPRGFLTKLNIPIKLNSSQEKIIKMKLVNHYNHENFLLEKEAFFYSNIAKFNRNYIKKLIRGVYRIKI